MANNAQKTYIGDSINRFSQKKVLDAIQLTGKALPCSVVSKSGSIVTVKFEINSGYTLPQITVPLFGPIYIRYPIQPGDKGVVIPCDSRLNGVSGIGGGVADLSQPANLTALIFLPIANTAWSSVDPNALVLSAPNGAVIKDDTNSSSIVLTPSGIAFVGRDSVSITSGDASISLSNDGSFSITGSSTGTVNADSGLTLSDSAHSANISTMYSVFNGLITWLNGHTHTDSMSGTTSAPDTPYSGGNIIS